MKILAAIFVGFISTSLVAAESTYTCVVKDVAWVSDKGLVERKKTPYHVKPGAVFIIKKETGDITGEDVSSARMSTEVLDRGGWGGEGGNNYKALSRKEYDPTFREIFYIEVMDNPWYKQIYPKPFFAYYRTEVISGVCK